MLIEIPDPQIILGFVVTFFVGLFVFYAVNKIKHSTKQDERYEPSSIDRLEYYERQLIDMKIRLDSLEINDEGLPPPEIKKIPGLSDRHYEHEEFPAPKSKPSIPKPQQVQKTDYNNTIDYVLGLITDKSMTSRDIQNASHRSREHVSRLMKKLYQEGYVERNTKTKPFTYSITDKGRAKIGILEYLKDTAA